MKFNFNLNRIEKEATPVKVDRWYDRRTRSWVVQLKDAEDNQVEQAQYFGSKREAVDEESLLKERYDI